MSQHMLGDALAMVAGPLKDLLDKSITENDRANSKTRAIWIKESVEADEEHANKSANDIKAAKLVTMTLLERLLYEVVYYTETGKHLDVKNVTLCAGSRYSDNYVPCVDWRPSGSGISIGRCRSNGLSMTIRAREVVS